MAIETRTLANAIRALSMDAVEAANSGHPGMPMGMADAATVLWTEYLKHDPADPKWPDRDRFVLSAGHGSMLIYSLLHLTGYARPTIDDIRMIPPRGPRNVLCVVVVTTCAWPNGVGWTPPATSPAKCAISTMNSAPTSSAIARNLAKSIWRG